MIVDEYKSPDRNLVYGDLLEINCKKVLQNNKKGLKSQSNVGSAVFGNGTAIHRKPLANEL